MKDYEQIITTLLAKIAELEKVIQQQAARITELEKRLNKNSSNSSKPPSSDGLGKPPRTTSLRENGKRNSGGQKGHKGETLKQIASPDIVKKHVLLTCPDCRCSLLSTPVIGIVKRQVFDITPPKNVDRLVYFEVCSGIVVPIEREKQIKGWSRKKKQELINSLNPEWDDLYRPLC
jgi:transposase